MIPCAPSSPCRGNHAKTHATRMASPSSTLVVQSRMALGLSQREFGDLVGRSERTIQRWEDRGVAFIPWEVETLARALHPVRPDLAAQVAAMGDTSLQQLGLATASSAGAPTSTAASIEAVVGAAAQVLGVSPDTIRPAIAAAFAKARDAGLDVAVVAQGLTAREAPV